jgi:hypothetical protein
VSEAWPRHIWGEEDRDPFEDWIEQVGWPTKEEVRGMNDRDLLRLEMDLRRSINEPGWKPEPWWREERS